MRVVNSSMTGRKPVAVNTEASTLERRWIFCAPVCWPNDERPVPTAVSLLPSLDGGIRTAEFRTAEFRTAEFRLPPL